MDITTFLVLSLATSRVAILVATEDGPFAILEKFRSFIGVYYDENMNRHGKNELAKLVVCVWCNSIWIGVLVTVLWYFFPAITMVISLPFALAMVGVIIHVNLEHMAQ